MIEYLSDRPVIRGRITFKQLEAVVFVVDTGTFRAAATALGWMERAFFGGAAGRRVGLSFHERWSGAGVAPRYREGHQPKLCFY